MVFGLILMLINGMRCACDNLSHLNALKNRYHKPNFSRWLGGQDIFGHSVSFQRNLLRANRGKRALCNAVALALTASCVSSALRADQGDPEELLVIGAQDRRLIDVADTIEITPDAAALLRKAPGANVNGNGPLSGIPQYRGMYGGRINVEVNGMTLSSGGPNWMDPPLHYAPAAQLQSLEVFRGIAPVSAGQETIGGVVNAKTWEGEFGSDGQFDFSGRIRVGGQSVNHGDVVSAAIVTANKNHRIKLSALTESSDDAQFEGGDIAPTEYQRDRFDVGYGFQTGAHSWQLDIGRNETGDSGTPALPMDIIYIDSDIARTQYRYTGNDWSLTAKLYYSEIKHGMSNYHLRQSPIQSPMMGAMWRRNTASGDNLGFKLSSEFKDSSGSWTLGVDSHNEIHNSDIDNPNAAMFFVTNFNEAEREVIGVFAERKQSFNDGWSAELGIRANRVTMDTDEVDATPAAMMMAAQMLRDSFNNADRSLTDNNLDWVAKLYYQTNTHTTLYLGLAQKTRSPSYQERYLWLPLQATGGLADGRTYTGNIDLDPEVASEIEFGFDYQSTHLRLSPRVFYRDIEDYIQGTVSNNNSAVTFVTMMNRMNGTNNAAPLQFNNVDAKIHGFDMDWLYRLSNRWALSGLVNYVRGERDDIDDDLYRIAPANASLAVNYQSTLWSVTAETVLYAEQDKVSLTNSEKESAGYGLLNLRGYWQASDELRVGLGVENVLDKQYEDHLAGYSRAANPDIALGDHLPGFGRNFFARVDYNW
jgi:iron complex outermembrane recepter protein